MDTKPIRELIEAARIAEALLRESGLEHYPSTRQFHDTIAATELALADAPVEDTLEKAVRDLNESLYPSAHVEALRLADELTGWMIANEEYPFTPEEWDAAVAKARAYRKKRGLENE